MSQALRSQFFGCGALIWSLLYSRVSKNTRIQIYGKHFRLNTNYHDDYEWARDRLRKLEASKKLVILELARRLEKSGMLVESICAEISNNLSRDGYVTDRYVRAVLDKTKYKRKYEDKFKEDFGSSSELSQNRRDEQRPQILVSSSGEQVSNQRPRNEENLVPVSELVGMERAINDRDKTIKILKGELQGAKEEVDFLRERECDQGFITVGSPLYRRFKHAIITATKDKLPFIRIQYEGGEAKDIDTIGRNHCQ